MKKLLLFILVLNLCSFVEAQAQNQTSLRKSPELSPYSRLKELEGDSAKMVWQDERLQNALPPHLQGMKNLPPYIVAERQWFLQNETERTELEPNHPFDPLYPPHRRPLAHKPTLLKNVAAQILSGGVQEAWVTRYDTPASDFDKATDMVIDADGNIYVTGYSGSFNGWKYLTIKYNAAGVQQWIARFNRWENVEDHAAALTVDGNDNVYVTGGSWSGGYRDYATVKYNSAGTQQWVAIYNGPGNRDDVAAAIAIDGKSNVYVTGAGSDYATVKYNSSGTQEWVATYNGPGKGGHDQPFALAVDGNVYVTGYTGVYGFCDYATVKYNSTGIQEWARTYNGPGNGNDFAYALTVDATGNVYVTGSSGTIKYNSSGTQEWVASEPGTAIAVDGADNIYVTGSRGTIKYNSAGIQEWVANWPGIALAVDGAGNVYVMGYSGERYYAMDYATVKYSSTGIQDWVATYSWLGYWYDGSRYDGGRPVGLAVDGKSNVYVAGFSYDSSTGFDYVTIKYTQNSEILSPHADAGPDKVSCAGSSVQIGGKPTSSGGYGGPYTYSWTPTTGLNDPAASHPIALPTTTITYTVTVKEISTGALATDNVTVIVPTTGWSVTHIVDVDDIVKGINQGAISGAAPRNNRGLALSPDELFLYLAYNTPADKRLVRKIDLSVADPAQNQSAVVAQLILPKNTETIKDIATDDKGRVYLALGTKIAVYQSTLQPTPLHTISGFAVCVGVATRRENGKLVVYTSDRVDRTLERFELVEGTGETIISSSRAGLDGDGEAPIIGASSPRGLDIASDGTAWITDLGSGRVYRVNSAGQTVDSTGVKQAMDIAIDETRGEAYVSQYSLHAIKVLSLSTGKIERTLTPPAADLNLDLDGEFGLGAFSGIDVASCQRVFVANEQGRSLLTGNLPDSPFSNIGDNNDVKAADTDPVLVLTGGGVQNSPPAADAGSDRTICAGASVQIGGNPTGIGVYSGPYSFSWTPTTGLNDPTAPNPLASPATTTTYTVTVTEAATGLSATDDVTVTVPQAGWSVAHIVDVDDIVRGINQSVISGVVPRHNRGLALSPDERFLYLGYDTPASKPLVRKIDLNVADPAQNQSAVVAQLILPKDIETIKDIATDDRGRVYLALGARIEVYNAALQAPPLHKISGFAVCVGVATRRENGKLVVYASDRVDRTLARFELVEGAGETITSSSRTGLDGDGEAPIIGARSPRGLDIASDGTAWITDLGSGRVYRVNPAGQTVDSTGVKQAMDIAIDETRGEAYVSQYSMHTIKVLSLSTGKIKRTLIPPAADLNVDLDGETPTGAAGLGAFSGIDVASCKRVFVANENGRSLLTGNPPDSPFSNFGDNNNVKAADTDPVLVLTGNGVQDSPPAADAGPDKTICAGSSVQIGGNPTGIGVYSGPYSFSWTPTTGLSDPTAPNPIASPAQTTTYTVTVTEKATTLSATDEVTVTVIGVPQILSGGVQQAWIACYDESDDYATAMTIDSSGNVYVTGYSGSSYGSMDYMTIKYNAAGVEQWTARYNGPGNGNDRAYALAVDGIGNVYVTGTGGDRHYATGKYNSAGIQEWVATYSGSRDSFSRPVAIAVDGAGNVYVTGDDGQYGNYDYATVKYNSAGTKMWVATYNGPGNGLDIPDALAVDGAGNVYVTGYSQNGTTNDYATVKYNSAGIQEWVATYNGSSNSYANALVLDGAGNVYVTGSSGTVKYNSAGTQEWVATGSVNGFAMAIDNAGNVYVTGMNGTYPDYDYATVKYNSAGIQEWMATYIGPGDSKDTAEALAVDGAGNIYVTGSTATIKYNSTGTQVWVANRSGVALAVDDADNVYVTRSSCCSGRSSDYVTVKYIQISDAGPDKTICAGGSVQIGGNLTGSSGLGGPYSFSWAPTTGLDNPTVPNPIASPATTTTYTVTVTETATGLSGTDDVTVTVPAAGWAVAHIVDVDDVILSINQGAIPQGGTSWDNRGLALSPDGQFLYLGYSTSFDKRLVRKIDLSVSDPANNHRAVVAQLKLLPDSQPARDIATDDRGRVYLTLGTKIEVYNSNLQVPPLHTISGFTACEGLAVRRENGTLVVYATDRLDKTLERFELVEGAGETIVSSSRAGLDGDGEAQIIGASSTHGLDITSDGTAWIADLGKNRVYRINSTGKTVDSTGVKRPMDIAIDETRGEAYVSQDTLRTIKVLSLSTGKIKRTLTPPAADLNIDLDGETGSGALCGIDVASCNRVFVANGNGRSILTGNPLDSPFSNIGDNDDVIAADTNPVLVVTGSGLAKEVEVEEPEVASEQSTVTSYELAQNYPNPFNPSTTIHFALPEDAEVSLKIYDVAGQLVQTLVDGNMKAGRHQVVWDGTNQQGVKVASGVYFYQLHAGEFKQVRKMSLVR